MGRNREHKKRAKGFIKARLKQRRRDRKRSNGDISDIGESGKVGVQSNLSNDLTMVDKED